MDTHAWLGRLVAIDTTSRNSNLPLIQLIKEWFNQYHITPRLTPDSVEPKANLFATLPAQDGSIQGGIILSGHTDVVPVDNQEWDTNPFEAVKKEDRIYGRGTCDMKGFLAVTLAMLPELQKLKLSYPIHFAYSYDEEIGCRGAPHLIKDLLAAGIQPKACIVGEPTDMRPIVGHKGIQSFRCRVRGLAVHSSLTPQGCNAIEYSAKLIFFIRKLADKIREEGPFNPHFDVPFTSISTNMIHGGIAANTIPDHCEFRFEFRHLPEVNPHSIREQIDAYVKNELLPELRREYPEGDIDIENLASPPSFEASEDAVITQLAREISHDHEIRKVAYATEAGQFQAANIPTIVCGPGNIEQAHRANEFVTIPQLEQCEMFLKKIMQAAHFSASQK
jgi:acetylornithine deacetylase